jgi:gluconate kinase
MNGGMQLELNLHLISRLDHRHSAAIDGLRHEIDYRSLATAFAPSFYLIFLRSSESCRFERLRERFVDFDSFKSMDKQLVEGRIDELEPLAALTIFNEGPLEQLHHQLDGWLRTLK